MQRGNVRRYSTNPNKTKSPNNKFNKKPPNTPEQKSIVKSEENGTNSPAVDKKPPVEPKQENKEIPPQHQEQRDEPEHSAAGPSVYKGRQGEKKFTGRSRLFVAGLNTGTKEEELKALFAPYGETGEVYVNNQKGFGFIRLDYRHNAEIAKSSLDKTMFKGRTLQVRFATHASAIELHGLDQYATNEYIENAMNQFGQVERVVVVCDDRGHSKGHAIVEFEWKKTAQKVLDRFKEEMFVLGRLPKPVLAKPLTQLDDEEGVHETAVQKMSGYENEREFAPRFISPSSFEYVWAKKWRDLYIEEEDKKACLEQELQQARYRLEHEMEAAIRQQDAIKIREELMRRQEELRMIEEDIQRRNNMIHNQPPPNFDRNKRDMPPRDHHHHQQHHDGPPGLMGNHEDFIRRQQAENDRRREELMRTANNSSNVLGIPEMNPPPPLPMAPGGMRMPPPHARQQQPGFMPTPLMGERGDGMLPSPPRGGQRGLMQGGGPPRGGGRHVGPPPRNNQHSRGGDRFDNKRPRRD